MRPTLSPNEARVIGCLLEKSVTTPDHYPLTLNALTNACNQKSSRNPVMALEPGTVQRVTRELSEKKLLNTEENFRRGVEKYSHRFYTNPFDGYQLDSAQQAVICLFLLRGPQTPGELRTRSARLHSFADNQAVVTTLESLMESEHEPLVTRLPRSPGRKDSEYMHLFGDTKELPVGASTKVEAVVNKPAVVTTREETPAAQPSLSLDAVIERLSALENEVAELKRRLGDD